MNVDDFKAEAPALNVVTITDVNDDISAQTFRTLTADVFCKAMHTLSRSCEPSR
jgi:hypothetical protein